MPLSKEEIARKRAKFLKQNAVAVAEYRAGAEIYCGAVESANKMVEFDRLPRAWRDLFNEYDMKGALGCLEDQMSPEDAAFALDVRRMKRQDELLSKNYFARGDTA